MDAHDETALKEKFGFSPTDIGNRHRGYWVITELDEQDIHYGAEKGDLCVKARDGACNPIDPDACKRPNFRTTYEDDYDSTYRYYIYSPLPDKE